MKDKVLLCGKGKGVIDDFFTHLDLVFELQSTSMRYSDMLSHLRYFQPDVLVFCMHNEADGEIEKIKSLRSEGTQYNVPLIIVGDEKECSMFQRKAWDMADLVCSKSMPLKQMGERIQEVINNKKKIKTVEHDVEEILPLEEILSDTTKEVIRKLEQKEMNPVQKTSAMGEGKAERKKNEMKQILVVDDDPIMLKLIKEQLREQYIVATAVSGGLALKFLQRKKVDLIILDYEMPGENGAEVLKKIREDEAISNLPVVFLTGINEKEKIQKVISLNPQGYLLKPIEREKLLEIIASTIG